MNYSFDSSFMNPVLELLHFSEDPSIDLFTPQPLAADPASEPLVWGIDRKHAVNYYLPRDCFREGSLRPTSGSSWCEWKGQARYFDLVSASKTAPRAAWTYEHPSPGFSAIAGAVAVMAGSVDRCTVNGEVVEPQPGGFYGGWVTSWVVGPFKGGPGSMGW